MVKIMSHMIYVGPRKLVEFLIGFEVTGGKKCAK
jgi:hypothetical protein